MKLLTYAINAMPDSHLQNVGIIVEIVAMFSVEGKITFLTKYVIYILKGKSHCTSTLLNTLKYIVCQKIYRKKILSYMLVYARDWNKQTNKNKLSKHKQTKTTNKQKQTVFSTMLFLC